MNEQNMPRRVVSFLLCACLLSLGAAFHFRSQYEDSQNRLSRQSQSAYAQLVSSVSAMETALAKAQCSGDKAMLDQLSAQIWRESAGTSYALAALPQNTPGLEEAQKFINQTGEYAFSLVRGQQPLSQEQYQTLADLRQAADSLCARLMDYQAVLGDSLEFGAPAAAVSSFDSQSPQLAEYPSLTYDGPFSDHLDQQEPQALKILPQVSAGDAARLAAAFAGWDQDPTLAEKTQGALPCYRFESNGTSLYITVQGGQVLLYSNGRDIGPAQLSPEQGAQLAEQFLEAQGFPGMKRSYYETAQGAVTVNFAPVEQGRTLYPDLIKVQVALDTGETVGFESRGYLMNHHTRQFEASALSIDQAQQNLSPLLTVESRDRALIPSAGQQELDCYEFLCQTPDGGHCLVYLDAQTGRERNILLLLEGAESTLTA